MGDPRADAERELRALRASWEWAFANAHGCSWGNDPRLLWVREREAELLARLADR